MARPDRSIRIFDAKRARHAKMHDEDIAVIEIGQEIFGAPAERLDTPARQPAAEILRKGKAQIRPPLVHGEKPGADQRGFEAAAHGFDLGKLGHVTQTWKRAPMFAARGIHL
jgi:hypothetical protein